MYLVVIEIGPRTIVQALPDHRSAEKLVGAFRATEERAKRFRAFIYNNGEFEEIH